VGTGFQPSATDHRVLRGSGSDDDVGAAHGSFDVGRNGHVFIRERGSVGGGAARDTDFGECVEGAERIEMCRGLDAAADEGEDFRLGWGQPLCDGSRESGGAHVGDEAAFYHCQRFAVLGIEEEDRGAVGGPARALVARIDAHELGTHRGVRHRRHYGEIALCFLDVEHVPDRLDHVAGRKRGEGALHGRDQRLPREDASDVGFGDDAQGELRV
jgi:hypothetical protein